METRMRRPSAEWLRSCSTVRLVLYLALLSESPRDAETDGVCKTIRQELARREFA